jgi:Icc-related predicted phosphoesterase
MRIICISDIHGKVDSLARILDAEPPADLILLAGDLTQRGGRQQAIDILSIARKHSADVAAVTGNSDSRRIEHLLLDEGVGLHGIVKTVGHLTLTGLGGIPNRLPWQHHYSEEIFQQTLATVAGDPTLILVTHTPPRGLLDRTFLGTHAGSRSVREWVDDQRPFLVVCGHIHESHGYINRSTTHIVNCGPAYQGKYAVVQLNPFRVETKVTPSLKTPPPKRSAKP